MKTTIASTTRWLSRSLRHFRWREILENDTTILEIAAAEKINESCVGRVLRLTLPPPDVAEQSSMAGTGRGQQTGPTGPLRRRSLRILYCEIRLMRAGWMTT